jgi:hypothetical protein
MSEERHTNASTGSHGPEPHKAQPPAYLPPPFPPPSPPMPLESGAGSRPALPFMTPPPRFRSVATRRAEPRADPQRHFDPIPAPNFNYFNPAQVHFDPIPGIRWEVFEHIGASIDSVRWGTTGTPQAPFNGPAGTGNSIYVQPDRPMFLNYTLAWGYLSPFKEGVLIARVGDGLIAPAHQNITVPPSTDAFSQVGGVFQLDGWPNPFPASLYGYHQVILDLWAVTPYGQPLPPEYQTSPPDPRKFILQSTDWAWLWVSPGCRGSEGGIDFCTIKSFSVTPTQVMLDPTGKYYLPNQHLTAKWELETLDLPPTQFGFKGSWPG